LFLCTCKVDADLHGLWKNWKPMENPRKRGFLAILWALDLSENEQIQGQGVTGWHYGAVELSHLSHNGDAAGDFLAGGSIEVPGGLSGSHLEDD
jgi:hypothetical protein